MADNENETTTTGSTAPNRAFRKVREDLQHP